LYFCPDGITKDRKRLQLFPMTLIGRAKDWLLDLPSGTNEIGKRFKRNCLNGFFLVIKFMVKHAEITNFEQGDEYPNNPNNP